MESSQHALRFTCRDSYLVGVLNVPERPLERGVLIIAGSAQYRAGSHRQYTLLARMLASRGIPAMRFDRRGSGDSEGQPRNFDTMKDDIHCAIKEFFRRVPSLKEVVLWGLCDGASAAALYGFLDWRVTGLILLNPWVHEQEPTPARAVRLGACPNEELEFWRNVGAYSENLERIAYVRRRLGDKPPGQADTLAQRVFAGLDCFSGELLVILSERDTVGQDFAAALDRHPVRHSRRIEIAHANHSFAAAAWRDEVAEASATWLVSW